MLFREEGVLNNLLEPLKIHKLYDKSQWEDRVLDGLDAVKLSSSLLNRYPNSLSGGEAQRVMIARSLLLNSELIILDEPTSMLDILIQAEIMKLLLELKYQRDLSYLFISHDLDMINYFCDEIIVMNEGNLIEKGSTDEVLKNPKEDYTKMLVNNFKYLRINQ